MLVEVPARRRPAAAGLVPAPLERPPPHFCRGELRRRGAKLLALLADELLFEPGLLDVTVTGAGDSSCWIPPGSVDEDGYRRRRLAGMRVGEPVVVAWTPEGDEVASPLVSAHVLEYHTLLRRSGLAEAPGSAGPASRSGPRRRRLGYRP